jgi:hypothetical protein
MNSYVKDYWLHSKDCFRPRRQDIFDIQGRFHGDLAMEECNLHDRRAKKINLIKY